ncbi:MAG TPA: ACP phosphodiesterase [Cyclobacteriaceae bacterium]|jgi:acyl carrier protein phosphodiesterase
MNLLAHLHLSGDSDNIRIGNFIGDFVRGNPKGVFPPLVCKGILMHRMIDEYTDQHEIVRASKSKLKGKYRHYSGVIVDIFYDHFLAVNWNTFSKQSLEEFTQECYSLLNDHQEILPPKVNYMIKYMVKENWLFNYRHLEGIGRSLFGMSRRTKFDSKMDQAIKELELHYKDFQNEFLAFYPQLRQKADEFLEEVGGKKVGIR